MPRLLGTEKHGGLTDRYWLHTGERGEDNITIDTVQDVEPIFRQVRQTTEATRANREFKYVASIPSTLVAEVCKKSAQQWGIPVKDAYAEIVRGKSDRAKAVWKMLTEGRDYSKLQAKSYGP